MDKFWYTSLKKSCLTPPPVVFKIVWSILYLMMFISLFYVISTKSEETKAFCYLAFLSQLFLNFSWSIVFFDFKNPKFAFYILILLILTLSATIILFYNFSHLAGFLLIPYLLWCCFALFLNFEILRLNF